MTDLIINEIVEDEEKLIIHVSTPFITWWSGTFAKEHTWRLDMPFTRSNGTVIARIYERLTKRSRRLEKRMARNDGYDAFWSQRLYRKGVYDAFKALQKELS